MAYLQMNCLLILVVIITLLADGKKMQFVL